MLTRWVQTVLVPSVLCALGGNITFFCESCWRAEMWRISWAHRNMKKTETAGTFRFFSSRCLITVVSGGLCPRRRIFTPPASRSRLRSIAAPSFCEAWASSAIRAKRVFLFFPLWAFQFFHRESDTLRENKEFLCFRRRRVYVGMRRKCVSFSALKCVWVC